MNKIVDEIISDIKNIIRIDDPKSFIISNIPYLLFLYLGNIFSKRVDTYIGGDIIDRIFDAASET